MSTPASSSRHVVLYVWVIALLLVAALVALKLRQNQRQNQIPALQQQAAISQGNASLAFYLAIEHAIIRRGRILTRAEVEAAVNGGARIPTHAYLATGANGSHQWLDVGRLHDPKTGGDVDISFLPDGSGWREFGPSQPIIAQPPLTPAWTLGEELRKRIASFAPWIWGLLLFSLPMVHRYLATRTMAQLFLGLGIVWFAAGVVVPYQTWGGTRSEFLFDLIVPVAATLFGLIIVIWDFKKPRPDATLCVHCSYNLTGNVSGVCPECGNVIVMPS